MQSAEQEDHDHAALLQLWAAKQDQLRLRHVLCDEYSFTMEQDQRGKGLWGGEEKAEAAADEERTHLERLERVGGVDISFVNGTNYACASLVVLSYPHLLSGTVTVLYEAYEMVELQHPYIPSYLAFREAPALLALIEGLRGEAAALLPQVLLVDGSGYHHPRRFGLACHLGVLCGIPTIGVAKKLLCVGDITREAAKEACGKGLKAKGHTVPLWADSSSAFPQDMVGHALRSSNACSATTCVYVSIGHRMSLETASPLVCSCCITKIPEPVRQADLRSRAAVRVWEQEHPELLPPPNKCS